MKKITIIISGILLFAGISNAKWWIFGKSKTEVGIKYMTINSVSADESAKKIKLFKEMLPEGKVIIKGKTSTRQIGSAKISLDGKASWQDMKFSENGDFEYSFTPEMGKIYKMYIEITETTGKTNNVDETYKEIEISSENILSKIKEVLDGLFEAYSNENLSKFMSYVSDNFTGDRDFLELAVKKDFNALSNINLRYTINNFVSGSGKINALINFNRTVMVNKTGQINTDSGITEFTFQTKDDKLLLYSMKKPLIFGLSDAENVSGGEVLGGGGGLIIDETGNLGGGIETVNISCTGVDPYLHPLYYFSTGEKGCHNYDDVILKGIIGEFIIYDNQVEVQQNGQFKEFHKSITQLTAEEVKNLSGYYGPGTYSVSLGNSYGIYMLGNFYAVEFISLPASSGAQNTSFKVRKF